MKNTIQILPLLLIMVIAFSGCNSRKTSDNGITAENKKNNLQQIDKKESEIEEFFDKYINTSERPIAVMVDNDDEKARPHAGLEDAYLIYEMLIEGGSTRFMALFRGADTEKIGPIRSSRHYYLDYVMENDAIYTHFGWSPKAMQDISSFGINKINGVLGGDENIFWREKKYKGDWHSAYTSIKNIKDMAAKKGFAAETEHKNSINYSDSYITLDSDTAANEVTLKYSYKYTTGYIYNSEKGVYEKTIDNKPHVLQSGETTQFKNIIIELIADTSLGDGSDRRNINTTGSGKGYYIAGGLAEEITWSKPSRRENTVYKKLDGTPLMINPGKTIINIISPAAKIEINE